MKRLVLLIVLLNTRTGICQAPDTLKSIPLQSVIVTAYKDKPSRETSLSITTLKMDSLNYEGHFNLSDLVSKTPGVNMLSTGIGIVKPVIRGLYGNRILILISGLKFDNQQWQEEHGLGLSDFGLSKVELIKGPMSVLYGTEAIGGIINLVEEEKPKPMTHESDVSMKLNSNTLGGILQAGYKVNNGRTWWRIRAGIENNADYSDGNNKRILNSRFDGYHLKTTFGFQKNNWTSTTNLLSSFSRFGFIFNDIYTFLTPDNRWSRNLNDNPAHLVLLNILSSENKFILKNDSKLSLNIGIQSNSRMENEGSGKISLNMHLFTAQYLLKWEKLVSLKNRIIVSNFGSFEDNKNFGSRKIIPDAKMQESNLSVYLETTKGQHLIFENGIGIGEKYIKTYFTATVNSPDKEVHPFSKFSPYYNLFSGLTYFPNNQFNIKANIATGVRIANLAELSSNGLHEGIFTYEIGDPKLKNEQNISLNLYAMYSFGDFQIYASPFYNYFINYIYLTPTNETWFGSPVYRYKQQNAKQFGSELTLSFKSEQSFQYSLSYSGMISKTADGNFTPFNPTQKITPSIYFKWKGNRSKDVLFFANIDYYFPQKNIAPNEIPTSDYALLNAGLSTSWKTMGKTFYISLSGNNLLNNAYYDHLSRFKYFGLLNIGRNIAIQLKIRFSGEAAH